MPTNLTPEQLEQRVATNKKIFKVIGIIAGVLVLLLVLGQCLGGGDDVDDQAEAEETAQVTEPTASPEVTEEPAPADLDVKAIAREFNAELGGRKIKDMCDPALTHWACFYDGLKPHSPTAFRVELSTPGDWTQPEVDDLAGAAALHWFNFVGMGRPELDQIIVDVNGVDTTTLDRRDVPLLN